MGKLLTAEIVENVEAREYVSVFSTFALFLGAPGGQKPLLVAVNKGTPR